MNRALRQDARLALLRLQHQQEALFASHMTYARREDDAGVTTPLRSDQGYYLLELQISADGMNYTAVARADSAGRQAADLPCARLAIDETGRRRSADAAQQLAR